MLFFVFSLMLFSGITTLKKRLGLTNGRWVVLSIAVMCALDEAESLEAPQVSTHYHYDSAADHRRGCRHWKKLLSVYKPFSAR